VLEVSQSAAGRAARDGTTLLSATSAAHRRSCTAAELTRASACAGTAATSAAVPGAAAPVASDVLPLR
jgi:hypothetical protein